MHPPPLSFIAGRAALSYVPGSLWPHAVPLATYVGLGSDAPAALSVTSTGHLPDRPSSVETFSVPDAVA